MEEIWKDIPGYNGLYQISNLGHVKSLNFNNSNKENLLSIYNHNGYLRVGIRHNKLLHNHLVHRLVAEAFIPNPENLPVINHKDGNKSNNSIENLEWVTSRENTEHAIRENLRPSMNCSRWGKYPISQYSINGKFIKTWISQREVERVLGFKQASISRAIKSMHPYKGFYWKKEY